MSSHPPELPTARSGLHAAHKNAGTRSPAHVLPKEEIAEAADLQLGSRPDDACTDQAGEHLVSMQSHEGAWKASVCIDSLS